MLTKVEMAKIFKIISKCYSNFEANDLEKLDIWHETLQEFNFELLKKIIFERLNHKEQGRYVPQLFDLLHDCRNKLALIKIKQSTEIEKIIEADRLFVEKQIDAVYCDYLNNSNPFENNYYQKITLDFLQQIGGWNFVITEFDKNIKIIEIPNFKFKTSINNFKKILTEKFFEFLKLNEKHVKLRNQINL